MDPKRLRRPQNAVRPRSVVRDSLSLCTEASTSIEERTFSPKESDQECLPSITVLLSPPFWPLPIHPAVSGTGWLNT